MADRDQQGVAVLAAFVVFQCDGYQVRAVYAVHMVQIERPVRIAGQGLLARTVAVVNRPGPDVRAWIVDQTGCGQNAGIVQHHVRPGVDDGSHVADRDGGRRPVDRDSVIFHLDGNRVGTIVVDSSVIQLLPRERRRRAGCVGVVAITVQVPGEANQRSVQIERRRRIQSDRTTFVDRVWTRRHTRKWRHVPCDASRHAQQERIGIHIARIRIPRPAQIARPIRGSPIVFLGIDNRPRTVRNAMPGVHRDMTVVHSNPRRRSRNPDSRAIVQE